ncbi:MAG TPA: hypothetical protein VK843_16805 [Planctomycetota bacterium]|nr:hypothetical protein [Planctomycetota bacterium]
MKSHAGAGPFELAVRVLAFFLLAATLFAQSGKDRGSNEAEEKFKPVDPYTKGDPELVKQAGYVRLEPFSFGEGVQAQDVVDALGGVDLLWAETAHFKICSTLQTYKSKGDQKENAAIEKDLAQLVRKLPGAKAAKVGKLDPWIRLHLYALRLERLYSEFCERTGFKDADFPAVGTTSSMGSGPYLGQKFKPTILLAEKKSAVGRMNHTFGKMEESEARRFNIGGSMFFGISAEGLRDGGYELETALHCALAENVIGNLLDGLRDSAWATPLWLDMGMGHWFSRRIDTRFTYYAEGTARYLDDPKANNWQPRVRGLVENKVPYTWNEMLTNLDWAQFTPQSHLLIWSRVDWMMQQPPASVRKFLEPITVALPSSTPAERIKVQVARATAGLEAGFGKSPEECEAVWTAWVLKTYDKD